MELDEEMYSVESSRCVVTHVRCYVSEAALCSILLLISLVIPQRSGVHVRWASGYRETNQGSCFMGRYMHVPTNFAELLDVR